MVAAHCNYCWPSTRGRSSQAANIPDPSTCTTKHEWHRSWVKMTVIFGVLLLHKDMLEHCGSPWVTLCTLSSHRCAASVHSAVPCQHSPRVCAGWHLGSCSSSCHQTQSTAQLPHLGNVQISDFEGTSSFIELGHKAVASHRKYILLNPPHTNLSGFCWKD